MYYVLRSLRVLIVYYVATSKQVCMIRGIYQSSLGFIWNYQELIETEL